MWRRIGLARVLPKGVTGIASMGWLREKNWSKLTRPKSGKSSNVFEWAYLAESPSPVPDDSPQPATGFFYPNVFPEAYPVMAPEKGPNRLNMKFTDCGRKVVIHLVRGLPPKISRDKRTITITFPEQRARRAPVSGL